jgi:hypothetical protein
MVLSALWYIIVFSSFIRVKILIHYSFTLEFRARTKCQMNLKSRKAQATSTERGSESKPVRELPKMGWPTTIPIMVVILALIFKDPIGAKIGQINNLEVNSRVQGKTSILICQNYCRG